MPRDELADHLPRAAYPSDRTPTGLPLLKGLDDSAPATPQCINIVRWALSPEGKSSNVYSVLLRARYIKSSKYLSNAAN
jgi:hypothetical protein